MSEYFLEIIYGSEKIGSIAAFRVSCYENSRFSEKINSNIYPDGFRDELDNNSFHFILWKGDEIAACSRLTLLNHLNEIPFFRELEFEVERASLPLWFYSRHAVLQKFRNLGLTKILDKERINFMESREDAYEVWMIAKERRLKSLISLGCKIMQKTKLYPSINYPFADKGYIYLLRKKWN